MLPRSTGNLDEASRRAATLAAMRAGADFIVDGQLALGLLSGCREHANAHQWLFRTG